MSETVLSTLKTVHFTDSETGRTERLVACPDLTASKDLNLGFGKEACYSPWLITGSHACYACAQTSETPFTGW